MKFCQQNNIYISQLFLPKNPKNQSPLNEVLHILIDSMMLTLTDALLPKRSFITWDFMKLDYDPIKCLYKTI